MSSVVLAYTSKSCVTGRALYDYMKEGETFDKINRVTKNKLIRGADVLIRWGNSKSKATVNTPRIEINKAHAVRKASNKLDMMTELAKTEGVVTPPVLITRSVDYQTVQDLLPTFSNEDGKFFARSATTNEVRLTDLCNTNDYYITKPINKDREYRVHVFGDEVLGVYEKVPNEGEISESSIMKDHNSKFVRCNMSMRLRCNDEAQAMCIKAVQALGLDFGGVDVIRERDTGKFYVVEVNSSPSLNNVNLNRYVDKFVEFINRSEV